MRKRETGTQKESSSTRVTASTLNTWGLRAQMLATGTPHRHLQNITEIDKTRKEQGLQGLPGEIRELDCAREMSTTVIAFGQTCGESHTDLIQLVLGCEVVMRTHS